MNVLLTSHGSRGDVYPMIALGEEFACAGHKVSIFTQPTHRARVEEANLDGIYSSEDMREAMSTMGAGLKGVKRMMEWSRASLEEEFHLLEDIIGSMDLVVCTNQEFSVASLAEWRQIPAFRLSYIPAIPGDHTPPLIPWQNLPKHINRIIWKAFGAGLDSMSRKTVNTWRSGHGLPAVKSLTPHMTSVFLTLYGFSGELAPPHPSWDPDRYRYCGYCFEDDQDEVLPPELEEFLKAGAPPVYLGFGSVSIPDADRMTEAAIRAAETADTRLVISRGWTGLGSPDVIRRFEGHGSRYLVVDEVSHTKLFPRCSGICHHGGAGTTHRAVRAGRPQFIMPVFIDQHFWGSRIHEYGAGPRFVPIRKVTPEILSRVFGEFSKNPAYNDAATRLAEAAGKDTGTAGAYRIIIDHMRNRESGAA